MKFHKNFINDTERDFVNELLAKIRLQLTGFPGLY